MKKETRKMLKQHQKNGDLAEAIKLLWMEEKEMRPELAHLHFDRWHTIRRFYAGAISFEEAMVRKGQIWGKIDEITKQKPPSLRTGANT